MEAEKQKVLEIIRQTIDELAFEELKKMPDKINSVRQNYAKEKSMRMKEAEDALFGGLEKEPDNQRKININEEEQKLKIKTSQIAEMQKNIIESLKRKLGTSPEVKLDIQPDSNQIISFPKLPTGKEFFISGSISFGSGKILYFSFSFLNGAKIKAKDFEIDKENRRITEALFEIYNDWKNTWPSMVSAPTENNGEISV